MQPIAIVGRAALLPGATDPAAFARDVLAGVDRVTEPADGRWGLPHALVLGEGPDRSWTARGGYVEGSITEAGLEGLDPMVHWLLRCGREALATSRPARTGGIFGNLSFPTDQMAAWGAALALGREGGDPRNHFMSGLPAGIAAEKLGLEAGAFCLDAACASSLFAIKLACDWLESGRADRMLAGAVQRADNLFLHVGFCRLGAMSRSGRSRPFHKGADGLLPAEGCVLFALKRLPDAERDGDRILGLIRGVGLSNDGRARGLLAPSSEGQVRAMRRALAGAGWEPGEVQLFECHATGTPTGDVTEVESLRQVYPRGWLGSLKSNFGHLITAAGAAGLLKVLAAMEAETMPPTLHAEDPIDLGPFGLLSTARPWDHRERRAAVSAFGFGGNNGHLLVEQHRPGAPVSVPVRREGRVAVVGMARWRPEPEVRVALEGLRFPPADLKASLAQQALALQLGRDALADAKRAVERDRLGVYVGMGCDGAVTRWGLRWRLPALLPGGEALRDRVVEPLRAEHVVGTMPNIPANRLSVQLDAAGIGFSLSAEQNSGLRALQAAVDALRAGELDAAVVLAVDLAGDPRSRAALAALGQPEGQDGAVALVLAREGEAYGWVDEGGGAELLADPGPLAAAGLLAVAEALGGDAPRSVRCVALDGQAMTVGVVPGSRRYIHREISGPVVRVPAHLPLPRLGASATPDAGSAASTPPRPAATAETRPATPPPPTPALAPVQPVPLPPAPPLPGVLDEIEGRLPPLSSAVVPVAPPAPAEAPPPSAHGWAPGPSAAAEAGHVGAPAMAVLLAHRQRVVAAHRAFLEQQAAVQRHFLAARGETSRVFAGLTTGPRPPLSAVPRPPAPPAPPTPAIAARPPTPVVAPPAPPAPRTPAVAPPAPPAAAPLPSPRPASPPPTPEAARPTAAAPTRPARRAAYPGPQLDRAALEAGASGPISGMFGPRFAEIDGFHRVVRMPMPPLLLADRVLGIEGPPMVLGKGTIWTETDIREDAWYLHDGRMPPGIMIESGQADLLLGSWQGIDRHCRSERIYRLLGCQLTWRGEMPKVGETLHYEIHIDGHAKLGDIRMFFFHYDCTVGDEVRLEVREGQAGFFSDAELADSGGILWDPAEHQPRLGAPVQPLAQPKSWSFEHEDLQRFAAGDVVGCFGPAFARAASHTLSPRIAGGRMLFLDRVRIDPAGGPWGRGHLRGEQDIRPDTWFFEGHFHNDPCMPGTLMFEGCMQAMALYLTSLGVTLGRDGWRFAPARDIPYLLRCRGQVIPTSKLLVYELFVEEVVLGPVPRLRAQVLCTVDGLKCFHADPLVMELVPDWPLSRMKDPPVDPRPSAYDLRSLLACAWGRPTEAFGPMYAPFDGPRKVPRLPGPPYHFMSRVTHTDGVMGGQKAGAEIDVEYDVPPDAWYFAENGSPVMPFAVLLEAALQPCGWLASWVGCTLGTEQDFLFRNLDGEGVVHREVRPDTGTLRTHVRLDRLSRSGGMIIVAFTVAMRCDAGPVYDLKTVFGFFPPEAFAKQAGVGSEAADRAWLASPGEARALRPAALPGLARDRLLMIDRMSLAGPEAFRFEKDVDPADWFFKAHFFQDPVQPGSLGIEAMIQALAVAMTERGLCRELQRPSFSSIGIGEPHKWKYRGQVVPENKLIQTELRITEIGDKSAKADAWLWVDGLRIYEMKGLVLRVGEGPGPGAPSGGARRLRLPVPVDHAPTWTIPALPMMTMALTALVEGQARALRDGLALRWLGFPAGPREVEVRRDGGCITLSSEEGDFFRAELTEAEAPPLLPPLIEPQPGPAGARLYAEGGLFHGPRFQAVEAVLEAGRNGARVKLRGDVPPDVLLDAATHAIPHDRISSWFPGLSDDRAAYPARLRQLALLGPLPAGGVEVDLRAVGVEAGRPVVDAVLRDGARVVAWFRLEEVLLPKGPIGRASPAARRAFLQGHPTPGVALSRIEGDRAKLSAAELRASDWLPGTVRAVYGSDEPAVVAAKELVAADTGAHPREVEVEGGVARLAREPWARWTITRDGTAIQRGPRRHELDAAFAWWRARGAPGPWPGERLVERLAEAWLERFVVHDPAGFAALRGRPCLFVANHENYLESPIFCVLASALLDLPVRALAKVEHQRAWLGALHGLLTSWPGHSLPGFIAWFDQADPGSLPRVLAEECRTSALLVHVEGSRQTASGQSIGKISSVWADLAVERGLPVVPVAFRGGAADPKTDVPAGAQAHHVGAPILPETLAALPYARRRQALAEAIDALPSRATVPDGREGSPAARIAGVVGSLDASDPDWARRWAEFSRG